MKNDPVLEAFDEWHTKQIDPHSVEDSAYKCPYEELEEMAFLAGAAWQREQDAKLWIEKHGFDKYGVADAIRSQGK